MIEKEEVREYIRNHEILTEPSFHKCFSREVPDSGLDLMMKLLQFNPNKRLSAMVDMRVWFEVGSPTTSLLRGPK